MAHRLIHIGCGGFGGAWCARFLPPNVADGTVEVVAAVDINPDALGNARRHLCLPASRCYTDIHRAFEENKADVATVVVPPAHHEAVIDIALAHGCHVLSEKPIADTLEGACRIAEKVAAAGVKMGVTMSHRFDQDKTTLRRLVRSEEAGRLDYLVMRFTCACREYGSWGAFRHDIPDTLMVEGAVHHLDILADLAGGLCETIHAETWTPAWGDFAGDAQGRVMMHMANGVRAVYEGAKTNAVSLNGWGNEYIRAECERQTLILDGRAIERHRLGSSKKFDAHVAGRGEAVPLDEQPKWANAWLIEKFIRWLDGGEPMETNVEDNLQSVALIFAAIESSRTARPVKVQELLKSAREAVR